MEKQKNIMIAASTGALVPAPGQGVRAATVSDQDIITGFETISSAGFKYVELSDIWLNSQTMSIAEAQKLSNHITNADLSVVGLSTLGIANADKALCIAQELGTGTLCLGLHKPPSAGKPNVSFWANSPEKPTNDYDTFLALAEPLKKLCDRAAAANIEIVMEMNENALIDRSKHVLRLFEMVGSDNLRVNPDLGNLTRVAEPMIETWYETLAALASRTSYWHVKNNLRMEHQDGLVFTHPSSMESGVIDYRTALQMLIGNGFSGPIVVESYWGDRVTGLETSRIYLEKLVRETAG